uniref:Protein kinase domain-containing protein n=1 Tax=viral metagenome TaxID=1070528 RepID=A0A6C0F4I1_9ZZZZ
MTTKTQKIHKNKKKHSRKLVGGRVIASGGYGCVFKPALKCLGKSRNPSQITKLMTIKHTDQEYAEIVKFKDVLSTIPDYGNYFLLEDITFCKPDKLSDEDLADYEKKCTALKKDDITHENINSKLEKVLALNMPNGGVDIGDYFEMHKTDEDIVQLNDALLDLLQNGILPMNQLRVYHCDVKESNILVQTQAQALKTRLIDWGLSAEYTPEKGERIPKTLYHRPFQYNVPFSIVLFNTTFSELYDKFLEKNPEPSYYQIRSFVIDYIIIWMEERGMGHFNVIKGIMRFLFGPTITGVNKKEQDYIIEFEYTYYYIVEYIAKILLKYTVNGEMKMIQYFSEVFLKNLDVWGFVMSYSPILEDFYNSYADLKPNELAFYEKLKYIFVTFLYETADEPVDVSSLVANLQELNGVLLVNATASTTIVPDKQSPREASKYAIRASVLSHATASVGPKDVFKKVRFAVSSPKSSYKKSKSSSSKSSSSKTSLNKSKKNVSLKKRKSK